MFSFLSGGSSKQTYGDPSGGGRGKSRSSDFFTVLVVTPSPKYSLGLEEVATLNSTVLTNGRTIRVVFAMWQEFVVSADSCCGEVKCLVNIFSGQSKGTYSPDLLLIRSEVRGVTAEQDFRNSLFALMYANVPSINSLHSIYCFLERPIVQAELVRLNRLHGDEQFSIVRQSFYASHREMMYGDRFPAVLKVGHAHSGYGKMRVEDHHVMEDMRSVLALTTFYASVEPFIEGSFDLRIQKVGSHLRAFKRTSVGGNWKTNTGSSHIEDLELTPKYRFWIEEASKMFGGLDICTVDAIHDERTGEERIMEVNGTSSGFGPDHLPEDNQHLKELILDKIREILNPPASASGVSSQATLTAELSSTEAEA